MTRFMTAHDLVNVYYVKPVFFIERHEKAAEPKPDQIKLVPVTAVERAARCWAAKPKSETQITENLDNNLEFQAILDEIGAMGNNLEGIGVAPEEVAKKYERKAAGPVSIKAPKNRKTRLENLAEKQRVKELTALNPKHVDVVKYSDLAKGWVVTSRKPYILLRSNKDRLLIHSGALSGFLKKKGQTHTTLRMTEDGGKKKLILNGTAYPFKLL